MWSGTYRFSQIIRVLILLVGIFVLQTKITIIQPNIMLMVKNCYNVYGYQNTDGLSITLSPLSYLGKVKWSPFCFSVNLQKLVSYHCRTSRLFRKCVLPSDSPVLRGSQGGIPSTGDQGRTWESVSQSLNTCRQILRLQLFSSEECYKTNLDYLSQNTSYSSYKFFLIELSVWLNLDGQWFSNPGSSVVLSCLTRVFILFF